MTLPDGYVRVTLPFVGAAVPTGAANVLCFANIGDLDADEIQDLINSQVPNDPWAFMSDTVACTEMLIKFGPDETGPLEVRGCAIEGTETAVTGAAAPALLVRKNTAVGGRRGRGRMFIPAIPEVRIGVGGVYDPAVLLDVQSNLNDWFIAMATASFPLVLEHMPAKDTPTVPGPDPTALSSWIAQSIVGTQRRRQRR